MVQAFGVVLYATIFANSAVIGYEFYDDDRRARELPCVCGERVGIQSLAPSGAWWANLGFNIFFIIEMLMKWYAYGFFGYWKQPLNCFDGSLVFLIIIEFILTASAGSERIGIGAARSLRVLRFVRAVRLAFACQQSALLAMQAWSDSWGCAALRHSRFLCLGTVQWWQVRFLRLLRILRMFRFFNKENQVMPNAEMELAKKAEEGVKAEETKEKEANVDEEQKEAANGGAAEEYKDDDDDDDDDEPFNPFEIPDGAIGKVFWLVGFPLSLGMYLTIPDCRREVFKKWWFLTFAMCIAWIAGLSYIMVWMVDKFGRDVNIPENVMGITFLAMGTSIPDCLSSIAVARRGHGDMAVSSSIGSNIFDILIGLPLPWILYGAILRPAVGPSMGPNYVPIISDALAVMILSLFVMVALVVTMIHFCGWILSPRLGMGMMGLYAVFLILSLLLEYDVILGPC